MTTPQLAYAPQSSSPIAEAKIPTGRLKSGANAQPTVLTWERALSGAPHINLKLPIQPKLTVNQPADAFEQEADHVAEQVTRMPEPRLQRATSVNTPYVAPSIVHQTLHSAGQPLDNATRTFMEPRFGADFSSVRVHTDGQAAASARAVNALAYTVGKDVVFSSGQYAPQTIEGQRLLAHELTHVVQQEEVKRSSWLNETKMAYRTSNIAPLPRVSQLTRAGLFVQRRPSADLIDDFDFLGNRVEGGLNRTLRDRLTAVEAHLQTRFNALPSAQKVAIRTGQPTNSLREWTGINSVRSWRPGSQTSKHSSGSAVDINYNLQPYIATRSVVNGQTVYGGEQAGAQLQAERQAATDVYDRAVRFIFTPNETADVSARHSGESTENLYGRFKRTSDAVSLYLAFAFRRQPTAVTRQPIANIEGATDTDLLAAIPETERIPETEAVTALIAFMNTPEFTAAHPNWPNDPRSQYIRMLRDYEHVRIPMQRGNPSASPTNTRNPTRGFIDVRQEIVVALVDVGRLRWGAADLGPSQSGDVHHFDLGNHGGVTPDGTP